jgi:glycosyltransferase involved in cell wall biosynthesis
LFFLNKVNILFLVINKNIDERIIDTNNLPAKVHVVKFSLITPVDLSNFAIKYKKSKSIYFFLKFFDYILRYPLLFIAFFYFLFLFKKLEYDKFITHNGGYPAALYCGVASFASAFVIKKKSIYVFHSMPRKYKIAYFGFDYFWDKLIDKNCIIVSVSKKSAIELIKVRSISQFPITIHNGIDFRNKKINTTFDELKIIQIGYVTDSKNQFMLLQALDILVNNLKLKVKISFIGDITDLEYKLKLDQFINANYLNEYVCFEGFRHDIDDYFTKNHLLVSTSKIESFPMTILEAMRIGMPIIATDVGGISEQIIDNYDGFIIKSDDYSTLANKIHLLFNPILFESFSNNSFISFNLKFSKIKMIDRYNEILS